MLPSQNLRRVTALVSKVRGVGGHASGRWCSSCPIPGTNPCVTVLTADGHEERVGGYVAESLRPGVSRDIRDGASEMVVSGRGPGIGVSRILGRVIFRGLPPVTWKVEVRVITRVGEGSAVMDWGWSGTKCKREHGFSSA